MWILLQITWSGANTSSFFFFNPFDKGLGLVKSKQGQQVINQCQSTHPYDKNKIYTDIKFIPLQNSIGVVSLSARMHFAGRRQFIIITFYFLLDQNKNIENKPKFTLVVSRYSVGLVAPNS